MANDNLLNAKKCERTTNCACGQEMDTAMTTYTVKERKFNFGKLSSGMMINLRIALTKQCEDNL
jgi:hypothetical protein